MSTGYPTGRDRRNRPHTPTQPCRDCRRPMLWATTPRGARVPFDLEPLERADDAPRPYLVLEGPRDWRLAVELHDRELADEVPGLLDGATLRAAHFDTCPNRARPRERADLA